MTPTADSTPPSTTTSRGWSGLMIRLWPLLSSVGASFGIVGLNLVQGILLARLLGPEGRGEYASAILFTQVLLFIGLFGGIEVIARHGANSNIAISDLRRAALQLALLTAFITAVLIIIADWVTFPDDRRYLIPIAVTCSLSIFGQHIVLIGSAVDRGRGDFKTFNFNRLFAAAVFPLLLLIAWATDRISVNIACILFTVAATLSCIPILVRTLRPSRRSEPKGLQQENESIQPVPSTSRLFAEGRPYALSMLATDLLERFDLLLFMWLTSLVVQGYYSAMLPVAFPLTVIPNTLGIFLFNAGARDGGELTKKRVLQIFGLTILIQAIMTIGFWFLVGPVVRLVYGEEFEPAILFAMWLAPIAAIRGMVQGFESYLKGRGQPMVTVHLRLIAAIVMGITIVVLYRWTDHMAIIQGSLVGQLVCVLALLGVIYHQAVPNRSATTH